MWLDLGDYSGPKRPHAFVMYCASRKRERMVRMAYMIYVTDSLQNQPQGKVLAERFYDQISRKRRETMTVSEVISHVVSALSEVTEDEST